MVVEYSVTFKNSTDTTFKLYHYGVHGNKAKTHQKPSTVLAPGAETYLSWNNDMDQYTLSRGHAYWVANSQAVVGIQMTGYVDGKRPFTEYQYAVPTGTIDGPVNWLRSASGWGETYSFCFTGEGGKKYKLTMSTVAVEGAMYTVLATIENFTEFWPN